MTSYFVIWRSNIRIRIVFKSKFKVHFFTERFMSGTAFIIFWMITSARTHFGGMSVGLVHSFVLLYFVFCNYTSQFCQCYK